MKDAISKDDLAEMNSWVDDHWAYVEDPPILGEAQLDVNPDPEYWIGNVEIHSYGQDDGVNFQNIVEGGPVFERLIDHPSWYPLAARYINEVNGVSIHENLLNVAGSRRVSVYPLRRTHAPLLSDFSSAQYWGVDGGADQRPDGPLRISVQVTARRSWCLAATSRRKFIRV